MRTLRLSAWTALGLVGLAASGLQASGTTSGSTLMKGPGARPLAMAEAYSALGADVGGIAAVHYNPAAGALLRIPEISFMGQKGFVDDKYGSLFWGLPTQYGTFQGGLLYYTAGDIELINTQGVSSTVNAQQDLALSLGYSQLFDDTYGTGISVKGYRSKLVDSFTAMALAMDLGGQIKVVPDKFTLGLAVQNIGNELRYIADDEPLPLTVRGGGAYRMDLQESGVLTTSLDLVKETGEKLKGFLGAEYLWQNRLAFRAGYKAGQEIGRYAFGLGFLLGQFDLDYAFNDAGDVGSVHSFSVGYRFGEPLERRRSALDGYRQPEYLEAGSARAERKAVLAVLDLRSQGANASDATAVSELLRSDLSRRGLPFSETDFRKLDPMRRGTLSDPCGGLECALRAGQELGADKVLVGSVSTVSRDYVVQVEIVDVGKARVEYTGMVRYSYLQDPRDSLEDLAARIGDFYRNR